MKKRKMKAGEALVGIKRSGSQLGRVVSGLRHYHSVQGGQGYLLRQNMMRFEVACSERRV
jgi:hypothetical protein